MGSDAAGHDAAKAALCCVADGHGEGWRQNGGGGADDPSRALPRQRTHADAVVRRAVHRFFHARAMDYAAIHVEAAQKDEHSILAFYRRLIQLRHEMPIIAEGDIRCIEEDNPDVIAYERTWQGEQLTVLCNFRPTAVRLRHLSLQDFADAQKLLGNYPGREECLRPYEVLALYRRA